MKLIVGLGNPGLKYKNTKHNVGFDCLDFYAKKHNLKFKKENKFSGESLKLGNIIMLKPHTFMNLSGNSLSKIMRFYDVQIENVIIIFDDLSMPIGKIRLREKGSAGGHNGVKSIIEHLGTNEFKRIKIGIDQNPMIDAKDYVLNKFSKQDRKIINESVETVSNIIDDFIKDEDFVNIMTKYN